MRCLLGIDDKVLHDAIQFRVRGLAEAGPEPVVADEPDEPGIGIATLAITPPVRQADPVRERYRRHDDTTTRKSVDFCSRQNRGPRLGPQWGLLHDHGHSASSRPFEVVKWVRSPGGCVRIVGVPALRSDVCSSAIWMQCSASALS